MIIAVPSVSGYIVESRKEAYVDTVKSIISSARNKVNEGKLELYDKDVTYYIDTRCLSMEGSSKDGKIATPYGTLEKSYVMVTYFGNGYKYFWSGVDDTGQGSRKIVEDSKLKPRHIKSGIKSEDIFDSVSINNTRYYTIIDKNCRKGEKTRATDNVWSEIGDITERVFVVEPNGPHQDGDIVTFKLLLSGFEEVTYLLTWQYSPDGQNWYSFGERNEEWFISGDSHATEVQMIYSSTIHNYWWGYSISNVKPID